MSGRLCALTSGGLSGLGWRVLRRAGGLAGAATFLVTFFLLTERTSRLAPLQWAGLERWSAFCQSFKIGIAYNAAIIRMDERDV